MAKKKNAIEMARDLYSQAKLGVGNAMQNFNQPRQVTRPLIQTPLANVQPINYGQVAQNVGNFYQQQVQPRLQQIQTQIPRFVQNVGQQMQRVPDLQSPKLMGVPLINPMYGGNEAIRSAGKTIERIGQRKFAQGGFGNAFEDVANVASVLPIGKLAKVGKVLAPGLEREAMMALNYLKSYDRLNPSAQIDVLSRIASTAKKVIPDVVKAKEVRKLAGVNPTEWRNVMAKFIEDRLVQSKNPSFDMGFSVRTLGKLKGKPVTVWYKRLDPRGNILEKKGVFNSIDEAQNYIQDVKKAGGSWKLYQVRDLQGSLLPPTTPKGGLIPPNDLIQKTVKYEGGWKDVLIQKSTGKEIANVGTSPEAAKYWLKNGYPITTPKGGVGVKTTKIKVKPVETGLSKVNTQSKFPPKQISSGIIVPQIESGKYSATNKVQAKKIFKQTGIAPELNFQQKGRTTPIKIQGKSDFYSGQATPETMAKVKVSQEQARVKADQIQYKEWQKQVFGEANTRTTTQAMKDLEKSMKTATNQKVIEGADLWKDKPRVSYVRETMERNFEDIMGKDAPEMKEKLLNPVFKAEAERTKFLNTERASIKSLGIKARSKESALVQELGEGKITTEQLKGNPNADKIIKAESVLRQKYDEYLTRLNTVLTRNGYDPIPKRKDYFHHFEDLNGMFEQIGVAIKAQDLPTDINGLTADFKPGKTFFNAALQRKGTQTSVDAITGIDRYLEGASNQIYHTDNIQALRAFETAIREKYAGTTHLSNFVADLGEYINKLAGKKAMVDRAVESLVGRRLYAGANALKSQTGANMVGANVSSAMTNWIPVSQTLATTNKKSVAQAMLGIIKNVFKDDGFIDQSSFLTSRLSKSDKLSTTAWQKTQKAGYWLFKIIDNFTSQLAVRSKYLEGLGKGLSESEAMLKADSWGRKTLGGRSAGEMPTLFQSKTLGFFTQFQLEVNNQLSFMAKDIPRNFSKLGAASAMGQLLVYWYAYNQIYEKMFGRRPAFDPIGVAQQAYEDYTNPNMKGGQANKNLVKNIGEQLPFTSALTGGRIPIGGAIPDPFAVLNGKSTLKKEALKPLYYLLPPTGGGQIKKTIEGISAYQQGASLSDSGRVRYPIPQTPTNLARTAIAGQYSTPEARQYFREGRSVLGEKQSEAFKQSENPQEVYDKILQDRKESNVKDQLKKDLESGKMPVNPSQEIETQKLIFKYSPEQIYSGNGYTLYKENDVIKTVDYSKPITPPKLTGYEDIDKVLTSKYSSRLTTEINNLIKLAELGQITYQQVSELIKPIKAEQEQIKLSKPKTYKPKAIKARRVSVRKTAVPKPIKLKIKTNKVRLKKYKPLPKVNFKKL